MFALLDADLFSKKSMLFPLNPRAWLVVHLFPLFASNYIFLPVIIPNHEAEVFAVYFPTSVLFWVLFQIVGY